MNTKPIPTPVRAALMTAVSSTLIMAPITLRAALSDGLVSYWPMEEIAGGKTPDLVSGYDMTLNNLTAADQVAGKTGRCFSFSNAKQTLLSRIHNANDDLPANKHAAFTVAFWAKVNGTGQTDLRLFSEGVSPNNNNPLFNLGTDSGGATGSLDVFIRNGSIETVNHVKSTAQPLDDTWHHITYVQRADGSRKLYVDGVADDLEIPPRPTADLLPSNDTTIGGILRASASHWVTGLIDEVAIWKRDLTDPEIASLKNDAVAALFPPEARDLVAHWPMETVSGGKTPDVVSGYDMTLNNLTAADLTSGKVGKCFTFSNSKQTLLSRIHGPADDLPANKHAAFTVAFWANVTGTGQADLRLFSEGFTPNNNTPLFNLGTHNGGTDGSVDVFIRNTPLETVNHLHSTTPAFDGSWHHVAFVQGADGSRRLYVDGVLDDLEITARPSGDFPLNDTTIGGILRASASHWVSGLIDEVAIWKRNLSGPEVANIKNNGVPAAIARKQPLELKSFTAEFRAVAAGDKVALLWEGSKDANYSITPGIGDVTAQTAAGSGTREVTVPGTTTYTLTATRGAETRSRQLTVPAVPGVAAGWHLLDTFEFLNAGSLFTQSDWLGAEGLFSVVDKDGNKAIGYEDGADLTALKLNSLKVAEGQKATLSFRVYVEPGADGDPVTPLGVNVGLTERSIRFNGDFVQNVGPYIRVDRPADGASVDILARNGVATGNYDGQAPDALQPGKWHRIWIDVDNKPFDVTDGVQNGGDRYSVHIQRDGAASRTTLFQDYLADRDAVTIDPALGAPTKDLTHVFLAVTSTGQLNNRVLFDDFFLSVGAYNATVPYVPVVGPTSIRITSSSHNPATGAFSLTWEALTGISYTVQRKSDIGGAWTTIATGQPAGGATGTSASYTDTSAGGTAAFYRVQFVP